MLFSVKVNESVEVLVENVNDNPPNFAQNHYVLDVDEVSSVGPSRFDRNVLCLCFDCLNSASFSLLLSTPALT